MKKAFSVMAFICLALGAMVEEPTATFVKLMLAGFVCVAAAAALDKVEKLCAR